ncbi:F-box protein [Raphanus sativus]|uniref:F-box protein At1g30790-like n=1 Tax=Raphanus sativus TaxID=3726 RepID=A0A6J0MD06_RAPSA|nr:F-box protein At1g30790-like [Raphanus sativus]KAJ4871719.1 F-box protein [Raphanus sativus]
MMERKGHEKGNRSILEPIPLDLKKKKKTRSRLTHHQKDVFCGDKSPPGKKLHVILPFDMEVETLTRLPGKSLMKFLCVSKTWYSLIRSQRFVASYYAAKPSRFVAAFTNSVFGDPKRLFVFSGEEEEEENNSSSSSLVANLDMTIPSVTLSHGSFKYSSVHGFMAGNDETTFIICNPSTGQVITFPCKATSTRLGYDPVGDQFKALTLLTSRYDHMHNPSLMCTHEVIRLGRGGVVVSRSRFTSPPYRPMTAGLSINGFIYCGASVPVPVPNQQDTPSTRVFVVCFDVRKERILSFITTPKEVLVWKGFTSLIEYKGKLAVVVPNCLGCASFDRFDLWILEDVTKHEWSRQSFELPLPLPFTLGMGKRMISQGTNKAGEIVFSPAILPGRAQPFYVFYFNPVTNNMRRVRIHGVADTEEFWSRYGLTGTCCASFSPQHADSIALL